MGRVTVKNLLEEKEACYEHEGMFIDFLVARFPNGFPAPHVASLGLKKIEVRDYDFVLGPNDHVVLVIFPGWELVATAVIGALVSTAINWAINALFGPDGSKPAEPSYLAGTPTANSVYTLSTPSNVAKLGQVIPVLYGTNPAVPDLAAQPYSLYHQNDQYICLLLCLGQGEFYINDILISDTSVDSLAAGTVEYWTFGPSDHASSFGAIQYTTGASVDPSQGVAENILTSIEVSDQELTADTLGSYESGASLWNGTWEGYTGGIFVLEGDQAVAYVSALRNGDPVWAVVTNAGANNGNYLVGFIDGAGDTQDPTLSTYGKKGHLGIGATWPGGSSSATIHLTLVDPDSGDGGVPIGPFVATPPGVTTSILAYDLTWPGGCYTASDAGTLDNQVMQVDFYAEPIDDNDVSLGPAEHHSFYEVFATNTPQRRTVYHGVPEGRYRVTAWRSSPKSDMASDVSNTYWVGLKAWLGNTTPSAGPVYGNVTLMAMRIKATSGISSDAATHITVNCTRKIEGSVTTNPASAFIDIYTNVDYGARRPPAELDIATISPLAAEWNTAGEEFNAIFDQQSTVWEAMSLSIQGQRAAPSSNGATVTIVVDEEPAVAALNITEDEIVSITKNYVFATADDYDGVEIEYRGTESNDALYVQWPDTADNPEQMVLWGCRDEAKALSFAKRKWAERVYRRELYTIELETEGHVILEGEAVDVTHRFLGEAAVRMIATSVEPKDQFHTTISTFRHRSEVFAA